MIPFLVATYEAGQNQEVSQVTVDAIFESFIYPVTSALTLKGCLPRESAERTFCGQCVSIRPL